jgi:hypothetical protein
VPAPQFATLLRESKQKSDTVSESALDRTYSKLAYRPPRG